MDISFSAQDLEFQKEVREFFATSFTDEIKQRYASGKETKAVSIEWQKILNDKGWVAPDWPQEYGGTG